ncbi:MAG: REP-associated tyrosine transposase [Chthoniobacterales bacterium]|jgi:putative transposase
MPRPESPLLPSRKTLPHEIPMWIDPSAEVYFVTINSLPRGENQLCTPATAPDLLHSASFRHESHHWFIHLFLLMPDHLHALLSFPRQTNGIQHVIKNWKAWTAKHLRIKWQRDFFEHRLRADEGATEKFNYILANPVRAGLVDSAVAWPWLLWSDPRGGTLQQGWGPEARASSVR